MKLIKELLEIESPTFKETPIIQFLKSWCDATFQTPKIIQHKDNLIIQIGNDLNKETLGFVGHVDVVPTYFKPYEKDGLLFGAGASDMKGGLGCFLETIAENQSAFLAHFNITFIIYSKEEGTPLHDNGLFELIQAHRNILEAIDCAIVAEPTDNTMQLGCVGSLHAKITVKGKACHSARPWQGENALYKALPLIQYFSNLEYMEQEIFGVKFYDVFQITESESERGRTSLPGYWTCNVNYRFSPNVTEEGAKEKLLQHIKNSGVKEYEVSIIDSVPPGRVIESPFFNKIVKKIGVKIEAKQAWTDVAQLTALGVPAFNFGPGYTAQAHKADEHISVQMIKDYQNLLQKLIK